MSFAIELQNMLQQLRGSEEQHKKIQNELINKIGEIDRDEYPNIWLYGGFCTSDEPFQIIVDMYLRITPKRDENGFVFLYSYGNEHDLLTNNYINVGNLQDWLRKELDTLPAFQGNKIKYNPKSYTMEVEEQNKPITLNMVPAFKFSWDEWPLDLSQKHPYNEAGNYSWFAVPYTKWGSSDKSTFIVCSPKWECKNVERWTKLDNFNDVLFLMKVLRDANVSNLPLSNYMLKTVLLHQLPKVNWKKDLGTLLIDMWACLVDHLHSGRLELYLTNEINIFDCMDPEKLKKCRDSATRLLSELRCVKSKGYPYTLGNIFQVQ